MPNLTGGSVIWDFDADSSKLTAGINNAQNQVDDFGRQLDKANRGTQSFASQATNAFDSVSSGLGRLIIGAGTLAATGSFGFISMAKAAYDQVKAVEDASFALRAYERDGNKVNQILSQLVAYARSDLGVLFQREDLFKAAANLRGFGDAAEDVTGHVKILSKGVALGMTTFDELSQIIGRSTQAGKLTAEAYDQLAYRGIVLDASLRGAAIGADQLYKALDGAISDKVLEGRAQTIEGQLIRLQSAFRDLGSDILGVDKNTSQFAKGGLGDTLVSSLGTVRTALKDPALKSSLVGMGENLAKLAKVAIPVLVVAFSFLIQHMSDVVAGFGALNIAFAAAQIGSYATKLVVFVGNILAARGAISAATAAQWGFNAAAAANPIGLIITAAIAVVAALAYLQLRFDIFGKAWQSLQPIIRTVTDFIEYKIERLKQIFGPFAASVSEAFGNRFEKGLTRAKQILADFGISLEFGGAKEGLATLPQAFQHTIDRIGQITKPFIDRAGQIGQEFMNKIAGRTEGQDNATLFDTLNGALDRIEPLFTAIKAALAPVKEQLLLTGEIIKTQIMPAWNAFMETLKPLGEALLPILKGALQGLAVVLGGVAVILIGLTVGFIGFVTAIIGAFANALPYIAQAVEGLIQIFRGVAQILTGVFTLDAGLVLEGFKQLFKGAYDFVSNVLMSLITFISGFIKTIISFFYNLYMALIGGSIIPDIVNGIKNWIGNMVTWFITSISNLVTKVTNFFVNLWKNIEGELSTWPGKIYSWGENIAKSFADGFGKLGDWLKEKITAGLNAAKSFLKGQSPPVAGPFKDIDKWGYNVGNAWVQGLESAVAGVSFQSPTLATRMQSADNAPQTINNGGAKVHIENIYVRKDSDVNAIAKEIGFQVELSPGYTDNG